MDLGEIEKQNVLFKITPFDDNGLSSLSNQITVDNWQEHQIIFDPIEDEREGTVELHFVLLDSTGDALEARFDYSQHKMIGYL